MDTGESRYENARVALTELVGSHHDPGNVNAMALVDLFGRIEQLESQAGDKQVKLEALELDNKDLIEVNKDLEFQRSMAWDDYSELRDESYKQQDKIEALEAKVSGLKDTSIQLIQAMLDTGDASLVSCKKES